MIDYNTKLIWLNETQIPESIQAKMCELDYHIFNLSEIKNNAATLSGIQEESNIEEIFDNIEVPF